MRQCSIEGCDRPHAARGWCYRHYAGWKLHGDPLKVTRSRDGVPPEIRFWTFVTRTSEDDCWIWQGGRNQYGYGTFTYKRGRGRAAHRYAYELLVGPIAKGLQLDHLCRVRLCVNPGHLEPVTNRENGRRGIKGDLTTHCPHGHPYDEENTTYWRGWRFCRACKALRRKRTPTELPLQ